MYVIKILQHFEMCNLNITLFQGIIVSALEKQRWLN
jgi:hypothetical protein